MAEQSRQPEENLRKKKPYHPPNIVYEEKMGAVAAVCSGADGKSPGVCTFGFS